MDPGRGNVSPSCHTNLTRSFHDERPYPSRYGRDRCRALIQPLFGWLAGFYIVPEGLAAPYARSLHGTALTVGLLMAAVPSVW